MKSFMRIFNRILFLLVVAGLLAAGAVLAWFSSWRAERLVALHAASTVESTTAGDIEYASEGDGAPVLILHGAPGGYDQALALGSDLADAGFRVIAPSRPGYLRTPLSVGLSPEAQADAMSALLKTLDVPAVIVVGFSFGAPVALEFARRHPTQTAALVLISAVTNKQVLRPGSPLFPQQVNERLTGDIGSWLAVEMAERDPAQAVTQALDLTAYSRSGAPAIVGSESQLSWFRRMVDSLAPIQPRDSGIRNDVLQAAALPDYRFEDIQCPTLFLHGVQDIVIPLKAAQDAEARFPNAEIVAVPQAGHLAQLGPDAPAFRESLVGFLGRLTPSDKSPAPGDSGAGNPEVEP
ncbi:MAG: alpha/beta hydrolase [Terrimicrobiaceae bacterium]|nr:alpha/beta hydrolase [Terrimicrobiaceae bacterium]